MHEGFLPHDSFRDLVQAAVGRIFVTDNLDDFLAWFSAEVYPAMPVGARTDGCKRDQGSRCAARPFALGSDARAA